jgi:hydrogenase maturation factor
VHAGFAIAIIDAAEARETLDYLAEMEAEDLS